MKAQNRGGPSWRKIFRGERGFPSTKAKTAKVVGAFPGDAGVPIRSLRIPETMTRHGSQIRFMTLQSLLLVRVPP
jgi:hypothetical protein